MVNRFWYIFGVSDTVGQHVTFRIRSFPAQISLIRSVMLLLPTLLQGSRLALGRTWNSVVINIEWVRLPSCKLPKFGFSAAKWLIKKVSTNFTFFVVVVVVAVFDKQGNTHCSINSISRPISSHDTTQPVWQLQWTDTKALVSFGISLFLVVVYIMQLQLFEMEIFLHIAVVAFSSFNAAINNFGKFLAKRLCSISLKVSCGL